VPSSPGRPGGVAWDSVEEARALLRGWSLAVVQHLGSGLRSPADLLDAINLEQESLHREQGGGGRGPAAGGDGAGPRKLSRKGLFAALARLRDAGLVDSLSEPGVPPRAEYWLTPRGHAMLTAASALAEDPPAVPGVDPSVPSPARVWNAWIGGKDNFAADRAQAAAVAAVMPSMVPSARAVRMFQTDMVQRLVGEEGVRQFLDIGTGLPVAASVHEVAQRAAPESRVVYVDNDPMVHAHARALLRSRPEGACDYLRADLRDPERILQGAARTFSMDEPVAIILCAVLHFVRDEEDPWGIVRRLADGLRGTAYLVISHAAAEHGDTVSQAAGTYNSRSPVAVSLRSRDEVGRFFSQAGFTLLPPGQMRLARWWPRQAAGVPADVNGHVGIGRRPAPA
jgi:hypothetical protein